MQPDSLTLMFGLSTSEILIVLSLLTVGIFTYTLPTLVALRRHHHQRMAIAALNFLLGWTLLGWVGALVWSLTATPGSSRGA